MVSVYSKRISQSANLDNLVFALINGSQLLIPFSDGFNIRPHCY